MAAEKKKPSLRWVSLLLLGGTGAGAAFWFTRPEPPIEVDVVRVQTGEVREMVSSAASGEVKPARRVVVRGEVAGTVAAVRKRRGERVAEGELVVAFSSDELEARLQQADANVEAAHAALRLAEQRREVAKRALDRATKLRAGEAISEVELDRAQTEAEATAQAVAQAVAAEKQTLAARRLAEVAKRRARVSAPFAGVLQDVVAEVGVQLAPGQPLFDLIDDSSVYVDVPVDEADVAKVSLGQKVTLRTDGQPGKLLGGAVGFIPPAVGRGAELGGLEGPAVSLGQKDRTLRVHVLPDDPVAFRVGASVNAEFLVRARPDVVFVPSHVVLGRGVERAVYRVERGVAVRVAFKAGLTSWERTEVLSGLAPGDELVGSLNAKGLDAGVRVRAKGP